MKPILLRGMLFGFCATALLAQQQQNGGWRKFEDAAPAGSQGPTPRQYSNPPANYGPPAPAQLTIPAGSWVTVRVNEPISSDHNHQGDVFTASLVQPLISQGFVVARRGQMIGGRVSEALKAGRVKGTSQLARCVSRPPMQSAVGKEPRRSPTGSAMTQPKRRSRRWRPPLPRVLVSRAQRAVPLPLGQAPP